MTILSCKENKDFTDEHIVPFREKQEDIMVQKKMKNLKIISQF